MTTTTNRPTPTSPQRLLSVVDYHRMAEVGILSADERLELIHGHILEKMPKGPAHSALCKRIEKLLEGRLGAQVLVRLQDPIRINDYSEPEPDIAVVRPEPSFYAEQHPSPAEVFLLIEIADTSLSRDLNIKANLYAAAGIQDYWVIDLSTQQLHSFRAPRPDGYERQTILRGQQTIGLQAFSDCTFTVQDLFGSGS
ncbi:MAG: Uma2 family endonuclease [Spirulinaceae cyanobacterium RM2_2_10]|nr:Uma2 family endonuclease [Spirulinaceae cyanobacterium SM2_1_0]NJO20207.1 Uma2 family endonuclease [Spirulinaceae cyanobacterium RM2_2_10]